MNRNVFVVIYIAVLVAVVVTLDLLFFRGRSFARLIMNVGIVFVFLVFYLRFLKKS